MWRRLILIKLVEMRLLLFHILFVFIYNSAANLETSNPIEFQMTNISLYYQKSYCNSSRVFFKYSQKSSPWNSSGNNFGISSKMFQGVLWKALSHSLGDLPGILPEIIWDFSGNLVEILPNIFLVFFSFFLGFFQKFCRNYFEIPLFFTFFWKSICDCHRNSSVSFSIVSEYLGIIWILRSF